MLRILLAAIFLSSAIKSALPHEHHGEELGRSCLLTPDVQILVEYKPGIVTVDGHAEDWAEVDGSELALLPALGPDGDKAYGGGKMTVKALHDGINVFFMLQVDGEFAYTKGANQKCPSVALMFQFGENATYHDMGGCKDLPGTCTSKSCRGHEVDVMNFSIGSAIPGRLYGANILDNGDGNGGDRFGHLVDVYAWNPHCRYLDGKGPSSFVEDDSPFAESGQKGTYYFEFSRPPRTMDCYQQDVKFVTVQPSKVAVAFWYPVDGKPWSGSLHYSVSCDWLPLDVTAPSEGSSYRVASIHGMLLPPLPCYCPWSLSADLFLLDTGYPEQSRSLSRLLTGFNTSRVENTSSLYLVH